MSHETPAVRQGERRLARKLAKALRAAGKQIAAKIEKLHKSAEEDERDAVLNADWAPIARAAAAELADVARDGAQQGLKLLLVDDETILDQTFDDAVEWARARAAELVGKSWDEDGELIDNPDADMAITETMRLEIRERVAEAIENGDSAKELGDSIEELGCFSEARAGLIARTEIIRAHSQGQMAAMRSSGVVEQKAWSTAGEADVCDDCQENEDEGPLPLEDDFPSGDDAPPGHPACLPGDALVLARGGISAVSKRWYDGDLVVIRTASGKELACTPNHPILTHGGFIAASLLNVGDEVFSAREWVPRADDDGDHVPARIHEVAEAFGHSGQVSATEVPVSSEDFHGDGGGSKVAVVWTDRLLRNGIHPERAQRIGGGLLQGAPVASTFFDPIRFLQKLLKRCLAASVRFMGSPHLGVSLGLRHLAPSQTLGLALVPRLNAGLQQDPADDAAVDPESCGDRKLRLTGNVSTHDLAPIDIRARPEDDASRAQGFVDGGSVDPVLAGQIRDRHAGEIFADPVVDVCVLPFSGHVFNLQTSAGWYFADGIVTHNCRCAVVAVVGAGDDEESDEDEDEDAAEEDEED